MSFRFEPFKPGFEEVNDFRLPGKKGWPVV